MKANEYVKKLLEDLVSTEQLSTTSYNGAFLTAALSIIREVESPMKEDALVRLAVLEQQVKRKEYLCGRKVA
jgi:hypothetical protein